MISTAFKYINGLWDGLAYLQFDISCNGEVPYGLVDQSDVIGASSAGAAPNTSSFLT